MGWAGALQPPEHFKLNQEKSSELGEGNLTEGSIVSLRAQGISFPQLALIS